MLLWFISYLWSIDHFLFPITNSWMCQNSWCNWDHDQRTVAQTNHLAMDIAGWDGYGRPWSTSLIWYAEIMHLCQTWSANMTKLGKWENTYWLNMSCTTWCSHKKCKKRRWYSQSARNQEELQWSRLIDWWPKFLAFSLSASVPCALQSWLSHFRRPVKSWLRAVRCRTRGPGVHGISSFVDIEVNGLAHSTDYSWYFVVNHRKTLVCNIPQNEAEDIGMEWYGMVLYRMVWLVIVKLLILYGISWYIIYIYIYHIFSVLAHLSICCLEVRPHSQESQ